MDRIESLKIFIDKQPSMFEDADATYNAIEELERLAEIGRVVEWAIEKDMVIGWEIKKDMFEINIDMCDLEDLVDLYKKEVEQWKNTELIQITKQSKP